MTDPIRVTLAGNPNSGKTTVFNAITGARHKVGNYPGVTIEKKEGTCRIGPEIAQVTDLPGIYSLTAYSLEEVVARNHLIDEKPDVVVDVIDSSNVERNLYLAVQLIELGAPLVLAFNMADVASSRGIDIDLDRLGRHLGVPIVSTVGNKKHGIAELMQAARAVAERAPRLPGRLVDYGSSIEEEIVKLEALIAKRNGELSAFRRRYLAVKLLEDDSEARRRVDAADVLAEASSAVARLKSILGDEPGVVIADRRYAFISSICHDTVRHSGDDRKTTTDRVDAILTHRIFGLPIFFGLMYAVFQLTFAIGNPLMDWIEAGVSWLGATITALWPAGTGSPLQSLLVDGIIGGVGGVIVFLPNIVLLFAAIALLEDTGYMARAAFMMDRLMSKVGLQGKSFIPMLIGFGCNVPAILATRTLEKRRDRMTTMLVIPLMSCSARLTIFALIIPAFFERPWQAPMLWTMYVIGIVLAIAAANLLRKTVFKGDGTSFVMELPPYHLPSLKTVGVHMWERASLYLRKAGTIILGISIVLWAMMTFPKKTTFEIDRLSPAARANLTTAQIEQARRAEEMAYSIAGRVGQALEPVLRPMGFDWRIGTALVGAFAAKEVFVAQMGIVYSVGEVDEASEALRSRLRQAYSPLVAFCIMLFTLIGTPCMATVAVTRRESGSWGWALFQFGSLTVLAYVLTVAVYQIGSGFAGGL